MLLVIFILLLTSRQVVLFASQKSLEHQFEPEDNVQIGKLLTVLLLSKILGCEICYYYSSLYSEHI